MCFGNLPRGTSRLVTQVLDRLAGPWSTGLVVRCPFLHGFLKSCFSRDGSSLTIKRLVSGQWRSPSSLRISTINSAGSIRLSAMSEPRYSALCGYTTDGCEEFNAWVHKLLDAEFATGSERAKWVRVNLTEDSDMVREYRSWRRRLPDNVRRLTPHILGTLMLPRNFRL
jgi:hypothetical protein